MKSFTYWVAECQTDCAVYSVRTKTKRECSELVKECVNDVFDKPKKVTIKYRDLMDLVETLQGEGGVEQLIHHRNG